MAKAKQKLVNADKYRKTSRNATCRAIHSPKRVDTTRNKFWLASIRPDRKYNELITDASTEFVLVQFEGYVEWALR